MSIWNLFAIKCLVLVKDLRLWVPFLISDYELNDGYFLSSIAN